MLVPRPEGLQIARRPPMASIRSVKPRRPDPPP
jgi:hypothetical protein